MLKYYIAVCKIYTTLIKDKPPHNFSKIIFEFNLIGDNFVLKFSLKMRPFFSKREEWSFCCLYMYKVQTFRNAMLKYLRNVLTISRYYVNLKIRTLKNIYQRFFYFPSVVGKPTSYSRHDLDDVVQSILER